MRKFKLLSIVCMALALQLAHAKSITDVKISSVNSEEQILMVTFDGKAPVANSFATTNPPRIAFDFSDTSVKLNHPQVFLNNVLVNSVTAVESGDRARLVLNLKNTASYSSEANGNTLLIHLNSSNLAGAANATAPVEHVSASKVAKATIYKNNVDTKIGFHRGLNGSGRIEVSLPANDIPVDVHRNGSKLLIDLAGVSFPISQERKLNVTDFGTPVSNIEARNLGSNGRIVVSPSGTWDFSSYQSNRKLVVEVHPLGGTNGVVAGKLDDASSPYNLDTSKKVYKGDKLTLNFQNVEIRAVLQSIADFTHTNIVTSDSVSGNITLRLQDVPWDQALDLILDTKGLGKKVTGNVIRIAPISELTAADTAKLQALKQLEGLEPIVSETFVLRYKKVEEFKAILDSASNSSSDSSSGSSSSGSSSASILSSRGSALLDPRTNTLIINDTQTIINKIRDLVSKLDIPLKQVLIEARIVEANEDFERDLGVTLHFNKVNDSTVDANVNLPVPVGTATSTISIITKLAGGLLDLQLSAMQTEGRGKIISSPRILTADRTKAKIKEGQEIPYPESSANGATTTAFKDAVLSLEVTPQITPDGNIIMDLDITKDSPLPTLLPGGTPALSTQEVTTQVMVENGGTVVIGGIYSQDHHDTKSETPYLSSIPVIGALFKENHKMNKRKELLVFITPRLVDSKAMLQAH